MARRHDRRTFGGIPNRDLCSLWGLIWGLPRDRGDIMTNYIRAIYGNGIKGPCSGSLLKPKDMTGLFRTGSSARGVCSKDRYW